MNAERWERCVTCCPAGAVLLIVLLLAGASGERLCAAPGDFAEPRRVTDGSGTATQTATGLDLANNAYISSVIDERIRVKIIGPDIDSNLSIAALGLGQADPDFATSSAGITYMTFSQLDDNPSVEGKDIYLTDNRPVGGFALPVKISTNRLDDHAPRLALDFSSRPHLAWAQGEGNQTRVMYWNDRLPGKEPVSVASGDYPHLHITEDGVVHLVYTREQELYYNSNAGGEFENEAPITTTPRDPENAASIGVDPSGNVLIAFESRNSLYYVTRPAGQGFRPPLLVDAGGILDPRMRVRSLGQVSIVYTKGTEIYFVTGQSTFLNVPEPITASEGIKSQPSLEIDRSGNLHVSYIQNGDVWYTNNASSPSAEFSANPTTGEVPLTVRFGDLSRGTIQRWEWDFGDGARSTESNPTHTYTVPGKYSVKLRVASPGATEAVTEKEDFVFVQDPSNTLRIPNQRVFPGQQDVWFPIFASHREPIQGFQLMGTFDPNILSLLDFEMLHSVLGQRKFPEFYQANLRATYFEVGCIFEVNDPITIEDQFLPAGQNQLILNAVFNVSPKAPQGARTEVNLINNRAISRIFNIFTVDGFTKLPALTGSTVEVIFIDPPFPRVFLRGDADGDRALSITDAVRILAYLFSGGAAPPCLDAADVTDRGRVDVSSAISLLNFLFLGGVPPMVPFPTPGLDPTEDSMPDCY
ncbi:MAG TPA: PKD domain-containing protein [Planctomycetota bacterium]|nr:PKD domain-containing protein [Planctomycetota bacterium]